MLKYDQLNIGTGGPWWGSLALPGLPPGSPLSTQEIVSGINRGKAEENISLTGGEPLAHPHIREIVEAVRMAGYRRILLRTSEPRIAEIGTLSSVLDSGVTLLEVMLFDWNEAPDSLSLKNFRKRYAGLSNIRRLAEWDESLKNIYLSVVLPIGPNGHEKVPRFLDIMLGALVIDRVILSWGEPGFPIWRAADSIQQATEVCGNHRVWAVTRGIPMCAVPENPYHLEELFDRGQQECLLHLPSVCTDCSVVNMCRKMPGANLPYAWEPKPIARNDYSAFINDIVEKGFVFDETNVQLYSRA